MKALKKLFIACALLLSLVVPPTVSAQHQNREDLKIVIVQLVTHPSLDAIRQGFIEELDQQGYQTGQDLTLIELNAEGDMNLLNTLAKQAVHEEPDYIIAITTPVAQAIQKVTTDIPVVLAGITDPVGADLVDRLEEPGGNISGISDLIPIEAQIDYIQELYPSAKTLGFIYSQGEDNSEAEVRRAEQAAQAKGYSVVTQGISSAIDMQKVAQQLLGQVDAVYVGSDNTIASAFESLVKEADKVHKPIFSPVEPMIEQGALAGLAIDQKEIGQKSAQFLIRLEDQNLDIGQQAIEMMENYRPMVNEQVAKKYLQDQVSPERPASGQASSFRLYLNAFGQGLLWAIMGLGLFISFRILKFADLTSEASFTIGAATSLVLLRQGVHPLLAILLAILMGSLAGLMTAILMTAFDIPGLLASIISLTALYSINLRLMGRPNLSLRGAPSIFELLGNFGISGLSSIFVVGILVSAGLIFFLISFFRTDVGQALIATGDNELMAKSLGIHVNQMKVLALMLSNGFIALCGSLVSQNNGFADVSMGTGTVVIALSAIVIGEVVIHHEITLAKRLAAIVVGAIIYQLILTFVLQLGFQPNDFKLISALVLALFLALPKLRRKQKDYLAKIKQGGRI
ncbi:ABC transporter substrate binding protein [Ignavigranum ruoffiae]